MVIKTLLELSKSGIVILVVICGALGYFLSFSLALKFSLMHFLIFVVGLGLLAAGSSAMNQAQESEIDEKMPRTQGRPIPSGRMTVDNAYLFSLLLILIGFSLLLALRPLSAFLGLATAILYNGIYTMFWKKKWAFGAVPGAIPGALPVVIGYSVNDPNILSAECIYLFLIMFIWQMPHFWVLALKYKDHYKLGGVPVLPVILGENKTLFHMGLYMFTYVGLAFAAPWFVEVQTLYFVLMIPAGIWILFDFFKFIKNQEGKNWLRFFLSINFSLLVFLSVPVIEKWLFYFTKIK